MIIDAAGVVVIVTGAAIAFVAGAVRLSRRESAVYRRFRRQLGQAIIPNATGPSLPRQSATSWRSGPAMPLARLR
jgi:hypothetical protein